MAGRFNTKKSILLFLFCAAFLSACLMSCKKNKTVNSNQTDTENQKTKKSEDTEFDFYNPYEDDASWVESLLARVEEERIAEELAKMEDSLSEYQIEEEEPAENTENSQIEENRIDKFFEEAGDGKVLSGKNRELRFYEFQNEVLSPQSSEDGFTVVQASDGNVMRHYYDSEYHLVKKEEW